MTGNGDVAATKFDGKQLSFNAQERYGRFRLGFGFHTTPLLFQDGCTAVHPPGGACGGD